MIGSFLAEWRKLRQRPAILVWAGLLVLGTGFVQYLIPYLQYTNNSLHQGAAFRTGLSVAELKLALYPAEFLKTTVEAMFPQGALFALLVGALGIGSEYGWGTLRMALSLRPGRLASLAGRVAASSLVVGIIIVLVYGAGAGSSLLIALREHHPVIWPAAIDIMKALSSSWLVLICYCLVGMALATLFRTATLAIGLGLAYMLIFEGAFLDLFKPLWSDGVNALKQVAPNVNGTSLLLLVGAPTGTRFPTPDVSGSHALVVLFLWIMVLMGSTAILLWRRDVT
jgi:ABC-2 type transport system permease protein